MCGRRSTCGSCEGLTYTTGSEQYDQVCGRIIGYQISTPDAFDGADGVPSLSIDSYYTDEINLTNDILDTFSVGSWPWPHPLISKSHIYAMVRALRPANAPHDWKLPTDPEMLPLYKGEEWFLRPFMLTKWEMVQPVPTKAVPHPAKTAAMCVACHACPPPPSHLAKHIFKTDCTNW